AASWANSTYTEIKENVNLNTVADKSMDGSGIDLDNTIRQSESFIDSAEMDDDENCFETSTNRKNRNKRSIDALSPEEAAKKLSKLTVASSVDNVMFMKGVNGNLAKQNPLKIKRALLKIDGSLKDDQIKYSKESLKIKCRD